jgi:hypothetical protein
VRVANKAQHEAKHQVSSREGKRLTVWDARRPASVRGTRFPLLLKHGAKVLDRAHGYRDGASANGAWE